MKLSRSVRKLKRAVAPLLAERLIHWQREIGGVDPIIGYYGAGISFPNIRICVNESLHCQNCVTPRLPPTIQQPSPRSLSKRNRRGSNRRYLDL